MTTSVEVTEVGRWYEARLLESTACCSGELFAVCHLLVSLLHLLKRSAQQLQSLAERGNAKLHKFAEVRGARTLSLSRGKDWTLTREPQLCIIAVEETVVDFPICIDDIFLRTFVGAVHSKVLPLDAQASTALKAAPGHVNGRHSLVACCKELRRVLSELPLALSLIERCNERWAPLTRHLAILKAEARARVVARVRRRLNQVLLSPALPGKVREPVDRLLASIAGLPRHTDALDAAEAAKVAQVRPGLCLSARSRRRYVVGGHKKLFELLCRSIQTRAELRYSDLLGQPSLRRAMVLEQVGGRSPHGTQRLLHARLHRSVTCSRS